MVGGPGSVIGIATGYGLDCPGIESRWGARFSAPVQTGPGAHPASSTMGTGSFPGVKSGRGVTLTPHPLLEPWSWKSRAIPLLSLWAVRPVQSLSFCTRAHFTFFISHADRNFSSLAWVFKFSKFSFLERKCVKWIWFKQKLNCEECIDLNAHECVILPFVSVFITPHLWALSFVLLLLHSLLRELALLLPNCARKLW